MSSRPSWRIAGLLFFSGLSALIYQTVWMREFRLIFGASTSATAAVLAIFMAGLGCGSALLGRRADAKENPLAYYARLELFIAAAAALSPFLLTLAAKIYFASGGSPVLGSFGATLLRLVLAAIVLGPATLLMGGTLPAAARAAETNADDGRRAVALLYGINTLGAVAGALLSTFALVETFGNRTTLLLAVMVNVLVALRARTLARSMTIEDVAPDETTVTRAIDPRMVYAAAAIAGFAFLLMELVWYRMLSPILGGTTYMFGLVLAVALLGIGCGGTAYALLRGGRAATVGGFALTCSLEALAVAIPFALGDRIAVAAGVMRQLGTTYGFGGHVAAWILITLVVVFPAAFVSGVQFPLLIALLGRGRERVGRQIGAAYGWNTAGAIAGSLAGGFGLLPLLTATGTWRLVTIVLTALAIVAAALSLRHKQLALTVGALGSAAAALAAILATGPTAVWRHGGIGVGRMPRHQTSNQYRAWANDLRRSILWEGDGRESSVALAVPNQITFIVNGKTDGSARSDAGTQAGISLIPALLHRQPKSAFVIGLGTGQSAGTLTIVPSMERVDVVELEPLVVDVAKACAAVNFHALTNPKVHLTLADAREVLLTTDRQYDLVISEPSNPYRAGIASLLTTEFYEAVRDRLQPNGIFAQWVQGYGIDAGTLRTAYATLHGTFPHVQTWWTLGGDLVLIASREPIVIDADLIRRRIAAEPFASATYDAWRIESAEGFLARLVGNEAFTAAVARVASTLNTDNRTVIEFGFARSVSEDATANRLLVSAAARESMNRPLHVRGAVDWKAVEAQRPDTPGLGITRLGQLVQSIASGDPRAEPQLGALSQRSPLDAMLLLGILRSRQERLDEATELLRRGFVAARKTTLVDPATFGIAVDIALMIARTDSRRARILFDALEQPFASKLYDTGRLNAMVTMAPLFDRCGAKTLSSLRALEPYPFWDLNLLTTRANCYTLAGDARTEKAWEDLDAYTRMEPAPVLPARSN
jgi:spermidine synthase